MDAALYSEALDAQLSLGEFVCSPRGEAWAREIGQYGIRDARGWLDSMAWGLTGEAYFWSTPVTDAVHIAAQAMPDWTLTAEMLPSERGFFWFQAAVPFPALTDHRGAPLFEDLRAVSWCGVIADPTGPGGFLVPLGSGVTNLDLVQLTFYTDIFHDGRVLPCARWPWPLGMPLSDAGKRPDRETVPNAWARLRLWAACLTFLHQEIYTAPANPATRGSRRRAERAGRPQMTSVRVVQLRRRHEAHVQDGVAPVDWAWRWVVSGHWRQQPCGPGRGNRRPTWVLPYVKGPEDKPLKPPTAKVFAVVR